MSVITLHIILYDELIRGAVTQIFRACRIKKGRNISRRTIRRRARRENHYIASSVRVERRSIGKCHLKLHFLFLRTKYGFMEIKCLWTININDDLINMWYLKKNSCDHTLNFHLSSFAQKSETLNSLMLQLKSQNFWTKWILKSLWFCRDFFDFKTAVLKKVFRKCLRIFLWRNFSKSN